MFPRVTFVSERERRLCVEAENRLMTMLVYYRDTLETKRCTWTKQEWTRVLPNWEEGSDQDSDDEGSLREEEGDADTKVSTSPRPDVFVVDRSPDDFLTFCAPMVGQSELAFRQHVRQHATDVCSTPMLDAPGYVRSAYYRSLHHFNDFEGALEIDDTDEGDGDNNKNNNKDNTTSTTDARATTTTQSTTDNEPQCNKETQVETAAEVLMPSKAEAEATWFDFSERVFDVRFASVDVDESAFVGFTVERAGGKRFVRGGPLIVQICANRVDYLVEAVKMLDGQCDAVELNLGCPQRCAKKGHYGAFLMEDIPLVEKLVKAAVEAVPHLPFLVKIRIFDDMESTVDYVKRLEASGASCVTVHGRTRAEKRSGEIRARWDFIAKVRQVLRVPVVSNGDIRHLEDARNCIMRTGCVGVMSALALLANPGLFNSDLDDVRDRRGGISRSHRLAMAYQYLACARRFKAHPSAVSRHMNYILKHANKKFNHLVCHTESTDEVEALLRRLEHGDLSKDEQPPKA